MNATYFGFNWEAAKSLIAKGLAVLGVIIVERFGITSGQWEGIAGIIMAIAAFAWSFKANTPTSLVKAAESLPEVKKIEVTASSGIADPSVTGPKVTTPTPTTPR